MILPVSRRSPTVLGVAAFSAVFGLALNRMDVGIFGYFQDAAVVYFPSFTEWVLSAGVVAAAGLVFLVIVEHFPIFSDDRPAWRSLISFTHQPFDTIRQLVHTVFTDSLHRVTLLAVFVLPVAFVLMYPPFGDGILPDAKAAPAIGMNIDRSILKIDGNRSGVATVFTHAEHQKRLGDSASCVTCHHLSFPGDKSTPCNRCHNQFAGKSALFDHSFHVQAIVEKEQLGGWYPANGSCVKCHQPDRPRTVANACDCRECHKEDMIPKAASLDQPPDLRVACSYFRGMHNMCVPCHVQMQEHPDYQNRENLSRCGTCHESLRSREFDMTAESGG